MQVKAVKRGQVLRVKLSGELDHHNAKRLAEQLDTMLYDREITKLQLDLKDLSFMDSSGIGVLLGRYKKLSGRGGSVSVMNENAAIQRIFQLSGLYRVIGRMSS